MLQYLRIALTALSLMACLLLVVLWVRSYSWRDSIWRVDNSQGGLTHVRFSSNSGELSWVRENALYSLSLQVAKRDRWQYEHGVAAKYIPDKFAWKFSSDRWFVAIPHWFAAAVLGAATVCASLIRWRFSLRTLLITTTLVAVVLGVVAVLS